jgi:hypothetical protein
VVLVAAERVHLEPLELLELLTLAGVAVVAK